MSYSDLTEDFDKSLNLLLRGTAALNKAQSTSAYDKLKSGFNTLLGGGLPSLDPGISEIRSKTNIFSGAEEVNRVSKIILKDHSKEYHDVTSTYFNLFIEISDALSNQIKIASGAVWDPKDFSGEIKKIKSEISEISMELGLADDGSGNMDPGSPKHIVESIFKTYPKLFSLFADSLNKNYGSLSKIKEALAIDTKPSDPDLSALKEVYGYAHVLNFAFGQFRSIDIPKPSSSRATAGTGGGPPVSWNFSPDHYDILGFDRRVLKPVAGAGGYELDFGTNLIQFIIKRKDDAAFATEEVDYFNNNLWETIVEFDKNGQLKFNDDFLDILDSNKLLDSSNFDPLRGNKEAKIIIQFDPNLEAELKALGLATGRMLMEIPSRRGQIIKAAKLNDEIIKISETATTPYYEAVSPSGSKISFTPADLVKDLGKLRDPKTGKTFKPKKIKGKSLADRVMSKEFGKVKK